MSVAFIVKSMFDTLNLFFIKLGKCFEVMEEIAKTRLKLKIIVLCYNFMAILVRIMLPTKRSLPMGNIANVALRSGNIILSRILMTRKL